MTTLISDMTADASTVSSALSSYYSQLLSYLQNDTSPYPDAQTLTQGISVGNIVTHVVKDIYGSSGFDRGALVGVLHQVAALQREIGMRGMDRTSYYSVGISDLSQRGVQVAASEAMLLNTLQGSTTLQQMAQ